MAQFFRAKEQYPDALLFFRMGDFYELFYDDAIVAAEALDIALTSRSKGEGDAGIPMAGVPWHSASSYIARLLEKGFTVAICEQMADPATVKGIVPREVVRVVTPGLALDPDALDARTDNVLVAIAIDGDAHGIAVLDASRAELRACTLQGGASMLAEVVRLDPREVLVAGGEDARIALGRALPRARVAPIATPHDPREVLASLLPDGDPRHAFSRLSEAALAACAIALAYARAAHPKGTLGIRAIEPYDPRAGLVLDETAVRNLELVRTLGGERSGSLLHLMDETRTAMGARLLRRRLLAPLADVAAIRRRHDVVEAFVLDPDRRRAVREALARIPDLERLATRAELGLATPRDLGAIRDALAAAREVAAALRADGADDVLVALAPRDLVEDVGARLAATLTDDLPQVPGAGMIRDGVDARIDELRTLSTSAKDVLLALEQREREASGIGSLRIGFTKVFGYYIEVTRPNLHLVPPHFRRKQTVANGERYTTDELDELQAKILNAEERARALELELFEEVRAAVGAEALRLRVLAAALADVDVHAGLAEAAHRRGWARPTIDDSLTIELVECRHPVVETLAAAGSFVPNDVRVDAEGERLLVITGPNMAGKSTTMRQVALAAIMGQMGSFVAATRARIGLVDRVFTRVGASDDLSRGQSTFMVEMRETATILKEATRRSLVILDEIGRGTSTYDGLAIAWAVAEYLHDVIGCRTLFATHYHELCELARTRPGVRNANVAAREHQGDVVFLHRLVPGASNRSYGIAVARLAGAPEPVLTRARQLLSDLEGGAALPSGARASLRGRLREESSQLDLFGAPGPADNAPRASLAGPAPSAIPEHLAAIERALRELDPDRMKPIDALVALAALREKLGPLR
jgi:DNA mismatch repair protein MutS